MTQLRPDFVIWSEEGKQVILGELSVPWEENAEVAHEYKMNNYTELVMQCRQRGWKTACFALEVGCRGFLSGSVISFLNKLNCPRKQKNMIADASVRASSWIWNKFRFS